MKYSAERIYVRFWKVEDASLLLDLQVRNRAEIEKISASNRDESFYRLEGQRSLIKMDCWLCDGYFASRKRVYERSPAMRA